MQKMRDGKTIGTAMQQTQQSTSSSPPKIIATLQHAQPDLTKRESISHSKASQRGGSPSTTPNQT